MPSAEISRDASGSGAFSDCHAFAIGLVRGSVDLSLAIDATCRAIAALPQCAVPGPDAGLLLCALLATMPDQVPNTVVGALNDVVADADLSRTWQPALDEAFELLGLLVMTKHVGAVARVGLNVLNAERLHPRWTRKAVELLMQAADLRPTALDLAELFRLAPNLERPERLALFKLIIQPIILADPSAVSVDLIEQLTNVLGSHYEVRYLLAALASHQGASTAVRDYAIEATSHLFPLAEPVRRSLSSTELRILCIQNIADGQGDEIIRVVPLVEAMLDAYPAATAVIVTDRGYLYRHSRVTTISFDETHRIREALRERVDVLLEFVDDAQSHLNHDPLLAHVINGFRTNRPLALDIRQRKGWNDFTFNRVQIDGMDWASALTVDRPLEPNVYDPVMRLMAELGLPLRIGEHAAIREWLLCGQESADVVAEWGRVTQERDGRRLALLNPFGGSAPLKGFMPGAFPDLARLINDLLDEGYDVLLAPSGQQWGSSKTCWDVVRLLDKAMRGRVSVIPSATSPSAFIQSLLSLIQRVDQVVTVEGWMMHAAFLVGKPYRLLTLPASDPRTWQPWGRSSNQRRWTFVGEFTGGRGPLPEQPRKRAWIELLRRIEDRRWGPTLVKFAKSDDPDLRRSAIDAIARSKTSDARRLASWLGDPSHRVRASAASALLDHHRDELGKQPIPDATWLEVLRAVGGGHPQWEVIVEMGDAALPALESLLDVDDPVIRREAAICIESIRRSAHSRKAANDASTPSTESLAPSSARERSA